MAMFHGHMIVFKVKYLIDLFSISSFLIFDQHGKRSGFRNLQYNDENTSENEDTYLLQVRGLSKYDTKAVQVNIKILKLNILLLYFHPKSIS